MTPLQTGALFKTPEGALYRLLAVCVDEPKPAAYVLSMEEAQSLPIAIPLTSLIAGLNVGEYRPVATPAQERAPRAPSAVAKSAADVYQRRRELIEPLVADRRIYERDYRAQQVLARALEKGVSPAHVVACLQLYWRAGLTFNALMPNLHACGALQPASPVLTGELRPHKHRGEGSGAL